MGWRLKKQLTYILIFFIIIFLFFLPFLVRYYKNPSCFNQRQDPGEKGVDCGGPCLPCEVFQLKDLVVQNHQIIPYPDNSMDVVLNIFNPNEDYGLKKFNYEIYLYGQNLGEISKIEGESFILPLEEKYILEINKKMPDFIITRSEVKINIDKKNWLKISLPKPNIKLLNYKPMDNYLEGEVVNLDPRTYQSVKLNFIFLNKLGAFIGSARIEIPYLPAEQREKFYINPLPPLSDEIEEIIFYPEVNLFQEYYE